MEKEGEKEGERGGETKGEGPSPPPLHPTPSSSSFSKTSPKRSEATDPGTVEYGVRGEGKVGAHLWLPPPLLSERVLALEAREAFSLSKRGNPRRVVVLFASSARECGWDT